MQSECRVGCMGVVLVMHDHSNCCTSDRSSESCTVEVVVAGADDLLHGGN